MGNTRKADIATGGKQCGTERNSTTKARAMNELSEELETPEGERKIYISPITKANDFTKNNQIKDEHCVVLRDLELSWIGSWKDGRDILISC